MSEPVVSHSSRLQLVSSRPSCPSGQTSPALGHSCKWALLGCRVPVLLGLRLCRGREQCVVLLLEGKVLESAYGQGCSQALPERAGVRPLRKRKGRAASGRPAVGSSTSLSGVGRQSNHSVPVGLSHLSQRHRWGDILLLGYLLPKRDPLGSS